MSLLPFLFDLSEDFNRPRSRQLLDQQFGLGLVPQDLELMCTLPRRLMGGYNRPWKHTNSSLARQESGSVLSGDKNQFRVSLDVQQFTPEDISVKVIENAIIVEGKHEEKQDDHGFISRHFVRRYILPEGHDAKDVISSLSSDGVLTVTAPRKAPELPENERIVPISRTGPLHENIENGTTKEQMMQNGTDN